MDQVQQSTNQPIPNTPPVIQSPNSTQFQSQQPTNHDTRFIIVILLLIFFYPIGLILMWMWMRWQNWVKVLLSLPVIITVLVILGSIIMILIPGNGALTLPSDIANP